MTDSAPLRPVGIRIPASTSNLGAGFDCVGLALDRYLTAAYVPGPEPLRLERRGTLAPLALPAEQDLLLRAFVARLARSGVTRATGLLRVDSEIPVARGLGSSAAAVLAGTALAAAALDPARGPDRDSILFEAEAQEGHPDNVAPSLLGGLVAVARGAEGRAHAFRLPLSPELGFAFAAPGVELPTATARAVLPTSVPRSLAARELGRLAALLHGLATGDPELLRAGFANELHVPHRLPLIPGGARALAAAVEAGAWAATISGAGSGLIAVSPPARAAAVAEAMAEAFRRAAGAEGIVSFPALPDTEGALFRPLSRWSPR